MKVTPRYYKNESADFNIKETADFPLLASLCYALSHELRLKILNQLQIKPHTVPELAAVNDTSVNSIVYHTEILQNAGLIEINLIPSQKGTVRMCYRVLQEMHLQLFRPYANEKAPSEEIKYAVKVGDFVDCDPDANYSFVTENNFYTCTWNTIYRPERHDAGIIWGDKGYLTYAFPNDFAKYRKCTEISLMLELCSETVGHNNNWKSDITFWLNDVELCTYLSPGDFGDRDGLLCPPFWSKWGDNVTMYGLLKNIKVNNQGVFLDGELVNQNVKLNNLNLDKSNKVLLKIGNKPNAQHVGGFNLFSKNFGDYPIDIELTAVVEKV